MGPQAQPKTENESPQVPVSMASSWMLGTLLGSLEFCTNLAEKLVKAQDGEVDIPNLHDPTHTSIHHSAWEHSKLAGWSRLVSTPQISPVLITPSFHCQLLPQLPQVGIFTWFLTSSSTHSLSLLLRGCQHPQLYRCLCVCILYPVCFYFLVRERALLIPKFLNPHH